MIVLRVFAEIDFRNRFLKSITFYNRSHVLSIGNFEDRADWTEIDKRWFPDYDEGV